jgi:hypothetical protein
VATKTDTTDVAVFEKFAILRADAQDIAAVLQDNLGGETLNVNDLPQIKVPAGGGTFWSVPAAGKPIGTDTLECVVVLSQRQRAYWPSQTAQRGTPPDCTPQDCPMAEWGSKEDGRGVACRETRVLYLLFPHMSLPMALRVPPTSLKAAKEYLINITASGLRYHQVLTRITLEKASNAGGQDYSKIHFEQGETMPDETHERMLALARFYQPQLKRAPARAQAARPEYDVEGVEV